MGCGPNGRHLLNGVDWPPLHSVVSNAFLDNIPKLITTQSWYKPVCPVYIALLNVGLVRQWMLVFQIWSGPSEITMLHFKLVPWQPMHQNPLDIVCKWTQLTCILWRSFSFYSPKHHSLSESTLMLPALFKTTVFMNLSDNRKHIKTLSMWQLCQWLIGMVFIQWN